MSRKVIELNYADEIEVRIKNKSKVEFQSNKIIGFIQREVKSFGNGCMIIFPKEYLGKKTYVVVCK